MRRTRIALGLALVVGGVARLWGAFDDGIYWPDEIYQSLEVAHAKVFGYGLIPWEFVRGARNWSLPGVVTVLVQLSAWLGLDTPPGYVRVVKLFFALVGTLTALGVHRLVRALEGPPWAAVASAAMYALAAPVIYFAPRAMGENASAAPLVFGLALLFELPPRPAWWRVVSAGSLLGLAVLFRLQVAVVVLGAVGILVGRRQWRALGPLLATLAGWAILYGALDAWTWHDLPAARFGGWFHSVFVYVQFNVVEGGGAHWGVSDWTYYFGSLYTSMPPLALALLLAVATLLWRRAWTLPLLIGLFLAAHLASPHKEYRFLVPVLPLAFAACGAALRGFPDITASRVSAVGVALAGWSALQLGSLTMGDLGAYPERPNARAWGDYANVNRLLITAGRRADLCGIRIDVADLAWTGGSTYLHRRAPLYRRNVPAQLGHFNYLIGPPGIQGLETVAEDSGVTLYRLPLSSCAPDPSFPWQLM